MPSLLRLLSRSTKRLSNCFMLASLFVSTAIKEKFLCLRESKGLCTRVSDPDSIWLVDPDLDPGEQKWPAKKREKVKKFHVLKCWNVLFWELKEYPVAWTSFTEAKGLQFLIKKYKILFSAVNFFAISGHRLVFSLKCWIRIRNQWIRIQKTALYF